VKEGYGTAQREEITGGLGRGSGNIPLLGWSDARQDRKIAQGAEHYEPTTEKNTLLRFRRHQIAYLMFPHYNLNVIGWTCQIGKCTASKL